MKLHILGICGTFMGGLALIARQLGHEVTGSDQNVYPPMSETLKAAGIVIQNGYDPANLPSNIDLVIVGNTISRSNSVLEYVLNKGIRYISGPEWLYEATLYHRHVLAVSGTHGKTTTTAMLAWLLTYAGLEPGYLIGGVPNNFEYTAALGKNDWFVIEADEYDSAFYDKRSKFIHYRPKTLIINNLEYDHADIFPDLEAIKKQFQILLRLVPESGTIIYSEGDENIKDVLKRGCWATSQSFNLNSGIWQAHLHKQDGSEFELWYQNQSMGNVQWSMIGAHNVKNAVAASAAAYSIGITPAHIIKGLESFKGVKRRLEIRGVVKGITVYDDFAHHPTAIQTTIASLRAKVGASARIIAIVQFGSNSMSHGAYSLETLIESLRGADRIELLRPEQWDIMPLLKALPNIAYAHDNVQAIIDHLLPHLAANDHVLIMSNKGFDGIHQRLLDQS